MRCLSLKLHNQRRNSTTNDTEKFTGYFRDAATGLDYADQRYHQPGQGRFLTSDPYSGSVSVSDPGSWNRYAYTRGDPVNRTDRRGLGDEGNACTDAPNSPGCADGFTDTGGFSPWPMSGDLSWQLFQEMNQWAMAAQAMEDLASSVFSPPGTKIEMRQTAGSILVNQTLVRAAAAIRGDAGCKKWLSSGKDLAQWGGLDNYLTVMQQHIGSASFSIGGSITAAGEVAGWRGDNGPARLNIIFNTNGGFFNGTGSADLASDHGEVASMNFDSDRLRTFLLLHELAHELQLPGFDHDGTSETASAQRTNNNQVWENCAATVSGFSNNSGK